MSHYQRNNKENDQSQLSYNSSCKQCDQQQYNEPACRYHQTKKAKYKVINVPIIVSNIRKYNLTDLVCSKCAVALVAQGYKVEELNVEQSQIRQEEIQQFLCQLQESFREVDQFEQNVIEKRNDLLRFCEKQKDRVKDHYQGIIFTIETKLRESFDYLTDLENKVIRFYDEKQAEIKEYVIFVHNIEQHNELLQMYSDIEVNLDNIIQQIEQLPYRQIMGQYNKRVIDVKNAVLRYDQETVHLGRVYRKSTNQKVLGGLIEDCELEIKMVQTSLTKKKSNNTNNTNHTNNTSRLLSPSPSTQFTSQIVFPQEIPQENENIPLQKGRSLSQPSQNGGNQKFLDVLSKVSENQLKTNHYYSSLLKHQRISELNSETASNNTSFEERSQHQQRYCSPSFKDK